MLTAAGLGIFFLAAAAWSYKQLEAVDIPFKHWEMTVSGTTASPTAGQSVELQSTKNQTGTPETIGRGTVRAFTPGVPGQGTLVVDSVQMMKGQVDEVTNQPIRVGAPGAGDAMVLTVSSARGVPLFERLYLQVGVASIILLVGTIITYYQVGVRQKSVEFLIATDAEMKKVNWSTRKEIMGSTYVVIGACFLIAGAIYFFDYILQAVFVAVRVLRPNG